MEIQASAAGELAVMRLADVLHAATGLLSDNPGESLTRGWRPSVSGAKRDIESDASTLVSAVRDAAAIVVAAEPAALERLVENFEA